VKTRNEKRRGGFKYQTRSREDVRKRANQTGGMYDNIFAGKFPIFRMKADVDYTLRLCPPTWEGEQKNYGIDVWVHYGVGPDEQSYLCLDKMKGEKCPVCEEKKRAEAEGDVEYAKTLGATKRVGCWVVDRADEETGPQLWAEPWTVDRDLSKLSEDRKSGEVLCLDDPEEGYDFDITRTGKGKKTKYLGIKIARKPSPLCDDEDQQQEWLDFIVENPVPDCLNYFDYEYIKGVSSAAPKDKDAEEEDEDRPRRRGRKAADEDEDEPTPRRRRREADEDDEEETPRARRRKADEEEEDDEPSPRRRRRDEDEEDGPPPRARHRSRDEDDEDEEEDRPRRSSRNKAPFDADDDAVESPYEEDRPKRSSFRDRVKDAARRRR
jgi:hypothetical protein